MPPSEHPAWYNIQLLRAIAVIMVALWHLEPFVAELAGGGRRYLLPIGYSGVDLFFLISGFINYHVSASHVGEPRYAGRFLLKRVIRIFPNYWIVLSFTFFFVLPYGMHPMQEQMRPIESYLVLYPLRIPEHILITGWTLNYEMLFYSGLAVLICLPRRLLWPLVAAYVLAVMAAQARMEHWNAERLWEFGLAPYFLQFFAGMGIAQLARRRTMPCPRMALCFGLLMAALTVWMQIAIYPDGFANPFHRDLRVVMWLFAYGPILYGLVSLEQQGRFTCQNRLLLLLGDASYSLYLWLMPFFFTAFLIFKWAVAAVVSPWVAYGFFGPLAWFGYLLFGCLWYKWVEKPMLKWINRMIVRDKS